MWHTLREGGDSLPFAIILVVLSFSLTGPSKLCAHPWTNQRGLGWLADAHGLEIELPFQGEWGRRWGPCHNPLINETNFWCHGSLILNIDFLYFSSALYFFEDFIIIYTTIYVSIKNFLGYRTHFIILTLKINLRLKVVKKFAQDHRQVRGRTRIHFS